MNRYFFYNFILVSFINLMLYVPHILISDRYKGAVMSLIIGAVIGTILLYMYTSTLARYPGKGLPEILKLHLPRWIANTLMIFLALLWLYATTIAIIAFAIMINRFFNPDVHVALILGMLVLACGYAATRSTMTVMLVIEIGLIVNAPIIFFVLFKAGSNPHLNWDAIRIIANYVTKTPTLQSVAAASYIFTGYISMSLFNRLMPSNFRFRHRWIFPLVGFLIMLTTFFVPIGIHGTETVGHYIYIWSITADALLMQYGFIERVLFLFLIVYLNLTLIFTMSGWHQAMEFVKSTMSRHKPEVDSMQAPTANYVIVGIFIALTFVYMFMTNEKMNMVISTYWLIFRLFVEIPLVIGLFMISRRRPRSA